MMRYIPSRARPVWPRPGQARWLCGSFLLVMAYASTIVGPVGPNFVPIDPADAFDALLGMRFVQNGSDQRADWIGNLMMLVPFGFTATAAIWPRRSRASAMRATALVLTALLFCLLVIAAIKYLQLFFPPRTVTLNYAAAQAIGALIGCVGFAAWHHRLAGPARAHDLAADFRTALWLYTAGLCLFALMPLDVALDPADLQAQADRLPATLLALPGTGRPLAARAAALVTASLAFAPVGALLALRRPGAGLAAIAARGTALALALYALSALVISAHPSLPSVPIRAAGTLIGAAALRRLARVPAHDIFTRLRALVPWLALPYLAAVAAVTGLLSTEWMAPGHAAAIAFRLGLLPLYDYYIVTKAEAAKNIAAHAVMYAPIGVAMWLRDPGRRTPGQAFVVAAALCFAVETARYLRPGLEGDINAVAVAGIAAMLSARAMPAIWSFLAALSYQAPEAPQQPIEEY